MTDEQRPTALGLLDVLVGEWTQLISGHGDPTGTMTYEWSLDHRYLIQRSTLPAPFPDSMAVIEYVEIADEDVEQPESGRALVVGHEPRVAETTSRAASWTSARWSRPRNDSA